MDCGFEVRRRKLSLVGEERHSYCIVVDRMAVDSSCKAVEGP